MPELPEVETTLRGITPHMAQQTIIKTTIRHHGLRQPIPKNMPARLNQQQIISLARRGKYLLLHLSQGTLLIHLGMSGRLHILTHDTPAQKHDHVDLLLDNHKILRYTDPRRFGVFLWIKDNPEDHALLKNLGPEPLNENFTGTYLFQIARKKKVPVKIFIMDQKTVVGVGNIYANESLFAAGIHPQLPANQVSLKSCEQLVQEIKKVLLRAIQQGGTTLKDFLDSEGKPGYFSQHLAVYGHENEPCTRCQTSLVGIQLGQRATVFCPQCQT